MAYTQTNTIKAMTLAALCTVLAACAEAPSPCGDGTSVQANGSSYCVYEEKIVIIGGFDCPASMKFRMDFDRATVCSNHGFDNIDVPNDICTRAFAPCTPIEDSDAAVAPLPDGGVCDVGFGDCDADSANGCETALDTLVNCGACGVACVGVSMTCSTGVCRVDTLP